jgi:hypothetical protein
MAVPLSPAALVAALRAEGVTVVETPGWRTHTRTGPGRPWGEVHGVMLHHTVTKGSARTVQICRDGYPGLPGPLCHGVIAKDGTVYLVGSGRTNHAGGGDPVVLQQVIAESYKTRPPTPTKGNDNGQDGNARFYGFECENLGDGKDPWSAAQVEAMVRVSAAICRRHTTKTATWTAKSTIGHLEWQRGKVDPRPAPGGADVSMPSIRARIAERLAKPADWSPDAPPEKKPEKPPTQKPAPAPAGSYIVKRGDSLYGIARTSGLTLAQLIDLNPQLIHPGHRLRVRK